VGLEGVQAATPGDAWLANDDPRLRHAWHPVARCDEIAERPVRAWLLGEPWVLARLGDRIVAFLDVCPHRRMPLSAGWIEHEHLRCYYHGWSFDESGTCTAIPALGPGATIPPTARLPAPAGIAEHLGLVWLAPDTPVVGLPCVPEADDPAFFRGDLPVMTARCSAGMLMDNFLDFAHFPFVHAATFGAGEDSEVPLYHPDSDGLSVRLRLEHRFANREDPKVATGEHPLIQRRAMTYDYTAPFAARLRLDFLDAGGTNTIVLFVQPETADRCRLYSALFRDDLDGDAERMRAAVAYEVAILEEDLAVQEAIADRRMPLALDTEVHTRADRITVELRRALARFLGATEPT
jgi:phenylpropionate dioxygenase-like ring-hydroxylating dioxygenase large terminal subunit